MTMSTPNISHRRTHNLLLISRLLSLQDRTSPFTLLLDSLEQSGRHVQSEFLRRAKSNGLKTILVSFETVRQPCDVDVMIKGHGKTLDTLQKEIATATQTKCLLVIDSLFAIAATYPTGLSSFLSSLISPFTTLLASYHLDVPLPQDSASDYSPHPLSVLKYLCTSILSTHSLAQVLAKKQARDRALEEPMFGLSQGIEGLLIGDGANDPRGTVIHMDYRRKSGRSVEEWFFLARPTSKDTLSKDRNLLTLLADHPLYKATPAPEATESRQDESGFADSTFNLGLTETQRRDRENVILPYFDAQTGDGSVGDGGRILYEMGAEDDFDEEEDEI